MGERFRAGAQALAEQFDQLLPSSLRAGIEAQAQDFARRGAPVPIAMRIASLAALASAPDIVLVTEATKGKFADVAATFFAIDARFGLGALVARARRIAAPDYYDGLARDRSLTVIETAWRNMASSASMSGAGAGLAALETWLAQREAQVTRLSALLADMSGSDLTLSRLAVAAAMLEEVAGSWIPPGSTQVESLIPGISRARA